MTTLDLLAAGSAIAPTRLDPLQLFLDADIVVRLVILGLVLASVWVWTIIFSFSLRIGRLKRSSAKFEQEFWTSDEPENLISRAKADNASGRVAAAGLSELRRSTKSGLKDRPAAMGRIAQAMEGQAAVEADKLAERLNFLATTGSVAPFIGLFGTVWGIMNSFFQIGMQQNSSLAVVAPGISEALFATAIGLFAAIPAVIAYNRFSNVVNGFEARLQRFADRVHANIGREMENS
ncbi:protein TolQ [Alteraurantiacibacter aestuarii]|uniref:Protein TolQ n=1 Tax=Alteraurantiacibacter aestuarii TaxID=650004 RepID=A0A844ZJ13_9SPHN|nr:protein TolQ [Alteraurantiacibacter aestuarii]MXO87574.1 protein TolQ [Alteraurantiacibacter aestuarii]